MGRKYYYADGEMIWGCNQVLSLQKSNPNLILDDKNYWLTMGCLKE